MMDPTPGFANLADIEPQKLDRLGKVWAAVLALPHAVDSYAMIIDGRPTRSSFISTYGRLEYNTQVLDEDEPSEHSRDLFNEIRAAFSVHDLRVDIQVGSSIPCR